MRSPLFGQVDSQGHTEIEFNGGLAGVPAFSPLFLEPAEGLLRVIWFDPAITVLAGSALLFCRVLPRRRRLRRYVRWAKGFDKGPNTQQFSGYSRSARAAELRWLPAKPLLIGANR